MSQFDFIYRSTMFKSYNEKQYRKIMETLKADSISADFKSIDLKIEKVLEQVKFMLSRRGKYFISVFKDFNEVEHFRLEIYFLKHNHKQRIVEVDYMPKMKPPAISAIPAYDFWLEVQHFIDDKNIYIQHDKMSNTPFRKIYRHSDNYNIELQRNIFWNSGFYIDNDGNITIKVTFRYMSNGSKTFTNREYKLDDLVKILIYNPILLVHDCFFQHTDITLDDFKNDASGSFKILEMIDI